MVGDDAVMRWFWVLLLMVVPTFAFATDYYAAATGGSGTASTCLLETPCTLVRSLALAQPGDTVILKGGTYIEVLKTVRSGTNANPIRIMANNRRKPIFQFPTGLPTAPRPQLVSIGHNWIVLSGLVLQGSEIQADTLRIGGSHSGTVVTWAEDIIVEDMLIQNTGDAGINVHDARRVTIRQSEINVTGTRQSGNPPAGIGIHLGSGATGSQAHQIQIYNNVVRGVREHQFVDFKNGTLDVNVHHNIFDGHVAGWTAGVADGLIRGLDGDGVTDANHLFTDNVVRNADGCSHVIKTRREVDTLNNVFYNLTNCGTVFIHAETSTLSAVDGNTTCAPAPVVESVNRGTNAHNQPMATCLAKVDAIVGAPGIASCEIGVVSPTTIVVNLQADVHPPVSSLGTLEVTYDGVAQTVSSTTLTTGSEARVEVAEPPVDNDVVVSVVAAPGVIKNSAYMGGKLCETTADALLLGKGVCGVNPQLTRQCVNYVGTPPGTELLTQAIWRFYGKNNGEGQAALGPEMTHTRVAIGQGFRLRVGVRGGGGGAAPSRSYALAARVCKPTCGPWVDVGDDPNLHGAVFSEDTVQVHDTATTNQLSLSGNTFRPGVFLERPGVTPAIPIASTEQVEWEYSLAISPSSTVVVDGNWLEFRIQHEDGTELSSYPAVPQVTIGASMARYTGSISGTVQ